MYNGFEARALIHTARFKIQDSVRIVARDDGAPTYEYVKGYKKLHERAAYELEWAASILRSPELVLGKWIPLKKDQEQLGS